MTDAVATKVRRVLLGGRHQRHLDGIGAERRFPRGHCSRSSGLRLISSAGASTDELDKREVAALRGKVEGGEAMAVTDMGRGAVEQQEGGHCEVTIFLQELRSSPKVTSPSRQVALAGAQPLAASLDRYAVPRSAHV